MYVGFLKPYLTYTTLAFINATLAILVPGVLGIIGSFFISKLIKNRKV